MKKLLVPIDFQNTTKNALNYGLHIARGYGYQVHALHLIASEDARVKAEKNMADLIAGLEAQDQKNIVTHVSVGKIESDIGNTAEELDVSLSSWEFTRRVV